MRPRPNAGGPEIVLMDERDETSELTEAIRERIRELDTAPGRLRELESALMQVRADSAEVSGDLEFRTMEWLRERQDAETNLYAYRDRARELKSQMEGLQTRGRDSPCPTCRRELADHFDVVMDELREEWDGVVQDGRWWRRRREQLELKPDALQELEARSIRLHARIEGLSEALEHARHQVRELEDLKAQLARTAGQPGRP
jgi:DNA repair exonuclease SbcCD ATPase subunit